MNLEIEYFVLGAIIESKLDVKTIDVNSFNSTEIQKIIKIIKDKNNNQDIYTYLTNLARTKNNIAISVLAEALDCYSTGEQDLNTALTILQDNKIARDIDRLVTELGVNKDFRTIDYLENKVAQIKAQKTGSFIDTVTFLNNFLETNKTKKIGYISTGFSKLDYLLGGGLTTGVYAIGAVSSLGKTALVQQIADNIAANGTKVLYFALEMSTQEMLARTVVRIANAEQNFKYNVSQLLNNAIPAEAYTEINKCRKVIDNIAKNITYTGSVFTSNIDNIVQQAIMFKNKYNVAPVIFVDYLQIIQPTDTRSTEKQAADRNIARLKQLSIDLNTPVIVISSVSRGNYYTYIDLDSFKESGGIEYGVDVCIGLQLAVINNIIALPKSREAEKREMFVRAKAEIPRKIELVILKNRIGRTGVTWEYNYNPIYNYFVEAPDSNITQKITDPKEQIDIFD